RKTADATAHAEPARVERRFRRKRLRVERRQIQVLRAAKLLAWPSESVFASSGCGASAAKSRRRLREISIAMLRLPGGAHANFMPTLPGPRRACESTRQTAFTARSQFRESRRAERDIHS